MTKIFNQTIGGFYRDVNKDGLPAVSGVYFVYTCSYDANDKTVALNKLIYIGKAEDINARIGGHEKYDEWRGYLKSGETLCYAYTDVCDANCERVEAAYIYRHCPPVNSSCTKSFNYYPTRVISTGRIGKLNSDFTVE